MTNNTHTDLGPALTALVQSIADKAADAAVAKWIEAQAQREERAEHAEPEQFYTVASLAQKWGVCRPTVERLVRTGELKSVRVGRSVRLRVADINAYLEGAR